MSIFSNWNLTSNQKKIYAVKPLLHFPIKEPEICWFVPNLAVEKRLTDPELLIKIRNPDTQNYGFNLLVREYQRRVYGIVRKMVIDHDDANDITQDVFIKIHKSIDNFREDSQLFTWIYRIATNECLSFLNKKKRRFFLPLEDVSGQLVAALDQNESLSGDEIQKKLQKAILTLPNKQRLVFNMKYFEDLTYEQMATITTTSVGALKASYHHAVKKIEDSLTRD